MRIKLTFLTVIILIFLASCSGPLELEVLFETNGGSPINSMVFNEESTFVLPNDPVKEGYTFLGWFLDATFDTPFSAEGVIALAPEDTLTIYAQWTINEYTITFDSDGGSEVSAITQDYASIITAPEAPTKEGYTFNGWDQAIPETMPAESLTLTATWTINEYTITFDSDGGSEVSAITQDYASIITAPEAPTKEGYTFNGWDQAIPETMPAESLTLTATWTINEYTITFDSDGGSEVSAITQDYASIITAPEAPTKEGYTFNGWDQAIPETMPAESLTLTATWTINEYTITFDSDGGSEVSAITQDYASIITAPEAPTKEGYTFNGWDQAIPETMPAESLTLTATWTINEYTITFDSDGGSEVSAITQDYASIITAPEAPTKEGYTFNGWDQAIPETMPAESLTLTATWTINEYTITFDSDGGSEVSAITQDYASIITAPEAPTKEGYTFNGWDQAIPETMPAESLTLTATWTINQYTLSIFNEFSASTTQDINFSQTLELTIIEVEGYRFKGWFIDEDFSTPLTFDSMPAYDLSVFAKYEKMLDNEWTIDIIKQSNNMISVNISVQGIVNFSGFDNIFKYNSNTLKIVSIENKINAVINSNTLGEIYFNFIDATNVINEDIEVISIIFEITTVGDDNFELNVNDLIAISENYNIIDVEHTVIFLDDR